MSLYAYCRVSTERQSLKRQMDNILAARGGAYRNAKFFMDKSTGSTLDRPEWNRLYKRLKPGDTVVFDSVSRLSRDAEAGTALYQELYVRGINLIFLKYLNPLTRWNGKNRRTTVCNMEVWCECFARQQENIKNSDSREITAILTKLGWEKSKKKERVPLYGSQYTYTKKP